MAIVSKTEQSSTGHSSPNINTSGGNANVVINNGVSSEELTELLYSLEKKISSSLPNGKVGKYISLIEEKLKKSEEENIALRETLDDYPKIIDELVNSNTTPKDLKKLIGDGELGLANELVDQKSFVDTEDVASKLYEKGNVKLLNFEISEAMMCFEQASSLEPNNSNYTNQAGKLNLEKGNFGEAKKYFELAIQSERSRPIKALIHGNIGLALLGLQEHKKAISYLRKSLAYFLRSQDHSKSNYAIAMSYSNLGSAYMELCQYSKASKCMKNSLNFSIKEFGESSDFVAKQMNNFGLSLMYLEKYELAKKYIFRALHLAINKELPNNIDIAKRKNNLALIYTHEKKYSKAIELLEESLELTKITYGEIHPDVSSGYFNLSHALVQDGKMREAIHLLKKTIEVDKKLHSPHSIQVAQDYLALGYLYFEVNNLSNSYKAVKHSKKIFSNFLPPENTSMKEVEFFLSVIKYKLSLK